MWTILAIAILTVIYQAEGSLERSYISTVPPTWAPPSASTPFHGYVTKPGRDGFFMSPGYPNQYPSEYIYTYEIGTGQLNQPITLRFSHFDLEYDPDCTCASVTVQPVNPMEKSQTFCGSYLPNTNGFVYSLSSVIVTFKSSCGGKGTGFYVTYHVGDPITQTQYTMWTTSSYKSTPPPRSTLPTLSTPFHDYVTKPGRDGFFTSPGYPNQYPSKYIYTYQIGTGQLNQPITLRFSHFDLEYDPDCSCASVTVQPVNHMEKSQTFCGSYLPNTNGFVYSLSSVIVTFKSVCGGKGTGFYATYNVEDPITQTQYTIWTDTTTLPPASILPTSSTHQPFTEVSTPVHRYVTELGKDGHFSSPGYPGQYPDNYIRTYQVGTDLSQPVTLRFTHFDLANCSDPDEAPSYSPSHLDPICVHRLSKMRQWQGCTCASLEIESVIYTHEAPKRFCGSALPNNDGYISAPGPVYVTFRSIGSSTGTGFYATYHMGDIGTTVPAHIDTSTIPPASIFPTTSTYQPFTEVSSPVHRYVTEFGKDGHFSSPGYPGQYPDNYISTYQVGTDMSQPVTLRFTHFDLANCSGCTCASLEIESVKYTHEAPKTFCGSALPNNDGYISAPGPVYVTFRSIGSSTGTGFYATYHMGDIGTTVPAHIDTSSLPPASNFPTTSTYQPFTEVSSPVHRYVTEFGKDGHFSSPGYPGQYPDNYISTYQVGTDLSQPVSLRFTHFNLANCSGCTCASLEIESVKYTHEAPKTFCGSALPNNDGYISAPGPVYVTFRSIGSSTGTGFYATYHMGDIGTTVPAHTGTLSTSNPRRSLLSRLSLLHNEARHLEEQAKKIDKEVVSIIQTLNRTYSGLQSDEANSGKTMFRRVFLGEGVTHDEKDGQQ